MKTHGKKIPVGAYDRTPLRSGFMIFILPLFLSGPSVGSAQETAQTMSLDDAKRLALERNLGLKSSETERLRARAEAQSRRLDFLPKFSAEARYSRAGDLQRIQIPAGAFSASPLFPPAEAEITTGALANYSLRFALEQPLFAGGSIYYAYETAALDYRSAGLEFQQAVQDLLLRVELAYWDILKTERLREVTRQQVADLEEHLRVVKVSHDAGAVSYHEVLKTEVNLAEARQHFLTARNNADLAQMAMNNLLQQGLAVPLSAAAPQQTGLETLPSYDEALDAARRRRMELASGQTRIQTLRARQHLAESDYYPKLSAVLGYTRAKETSTVVPENWEVLGMLHWTFWEWGKTGKEVEQAKIRLRRSELDFRALEERIALEVREQHFRAVEAQEKIAVAETAVKQAEENFRITRERFGAGVATNTEVLDAESLLVSARANHANAFYDFRSARARLIRAMGTETTASRKEGGR